MTTSRRCFAYLLGLLLSCSIAIADQEVVTTRILGGTEASEGLWPSMVALVRTGNASLFQRQFCGASKIASRWVLTAAHCLFDSQGNQVPVSSIRAAMGVTDLQDEASANEVGIAAIWVHPFYDPDGDYAYHDVAVLELVTDTSDPSLPLYPLNPDTQTGESAIVVGWGSLTYSEIAPLTFPTVLNQVTVPLVSRSQCNEPGSYGGIVSAGQICAGFSAGSKDSCVGDSGGPLMLLQGGIFKQAGIVSFGVGCGLPDKFGIYTNVNFYSPWIAEVISGQATPANGQDRDGSKSGGASGWFILFALILAGAQRRCLRNRVLNRKPQ